MTDTPPPPGLPQAPLADNTTLSVGDVVQISVQLLDKTTGQPFWWKRFAVVMSLIGRRHFRALTLKLNPDMDQDMRTVSFSVDDKERPQVVTKLREPWPSGVAAMHMKLLTLGIIKMEE